MGVLRNECFAPGCDNRIQEQSPAALTFLLFGCQTSNSVIEISLIFCFCSQGVAENCVSSAGAGMWFQL